MHLQRPADKRPTIGESALQERDSYLLPNIRVVVRILCTLPVTSCECEQSARVLCHLPNFMHVGMTESRLMSLALMHIHCQHRIDTNTVVKLFAELHP